MKIENVTFFCDCFRNFFFCFNPWNINFKHRTIHIINLLKRICIFPRSFHRAISIEKRINTWRLVYFKICFIRWYIRPFPLTHPFPFDVLLLLLCVYVCIRVYASFHFRSYLRWDTRFFKISKGIAAKGIKGRGKLCLCFIHNPTYKNTMEVSWPEGSHAEIFHENRSYRSCLPLSWHPFVTQASEYIPCLPRNMYYCSDVNAYIFNV